MRRLPPLFLVPIIAAAIIVLVLVAGALRDSRKGGLSEVPGYEVGFPDGQQLDLQKTPGFGVPSTEDRIYGTATSVEAIVSYFDEHLMAAGYRRVRGPEGEGEGDRYLGEYEQDGVVWEIILRAMPARVNGQFYVRGERGIERVVTVRIKGQP